MKKINIRISVIVIFIMFILSVILHTNADTVGSFNISTGTNQLKVGGTTTLTITTTNCEGQFTISSSDNSVVSVSSKSEWAGKVNITLTAKKAGTAVITVTASDVADNQPEPQVVKGSKTVKITVKEEEKVDSNTNQNNQNDQNNTNNSGETTQKPTGTENEQKPTQPTTQPEKPIQTNDSEKKEPEFKEVKETVYAIKDSVTVRGACSTKGGQYGSLKLGESVERIGISTEKIDGYTWSKVLYNGKTAYIASSLIDTEKPEQKSSIKNLKSLVIEDYELQPGFTPSTINYNIVLNQGDSTLNIKAIPEDEKATVNITGNEKFKVGNNIVKITVTAEDGSSKTYTVTVSKANEDGNLEMLKLSKLEIAGVNLEPNFTPDVTNYVVIVDEPSSITEEKIVAIAENDKIKVSIAENDNETDGNKVITIMLESADGKKTGVYQINVKKLVITQVANLENVMNNTDNSVYYILGGIIGLLLVLIIIIIIVLRKTRNVDENDPEYRISADELSDKYNVLDSEGEDIEESEFDDDMIEQSSFRTQILNSNINISKEDDDIENFDINVSDDSEDDYKPNFNKKKGKHF